jgi:ATP-dependent DNA helicase PIF1
LAGELEYMSNNLPCVSVLPLKVGSQVMCVVNKEMNTLSGKVVALCNGSQGVIESFCSITGYPVVKFRNGVTCPMNPHCWKSEKIPGVAVEQIPLILAWAITIHKSQGSTLQSAEIDLGNDVFECGQTYVALSRVKSLDGLYLTSFDCSKIKCNPLVKKFYGDS